MRSVNPLRGPGSYFSFLFKQLLIRASLLNAEGQWNTVIIHAPACLHNGSKPILVTFAIGFRSDLFLNRKK